MKDSSTLRCRGVQLSQSMFRKRLLRRCNKCEARSTSIFSIHWKRKLNIKKIGRWCFSVIDPWESLAQQCSEWISNIQDVIQKLDFSHCDHMKNTLKRQKERTTSQSTYLRACLCTSYPIVEEFVVPTMTSSAISQATKLD